MSYFQPSGLGIELFQAGTSPGPWGGLPGPILPLGPVGPGPTAPATGMFPTNFKPGDVVMVSGNFGGVSQGQVRVKVEGAPWMAPMIMGPFQASFVVPEGAQTGACQIEINGQIVFGSQCTVSSPEGSTFYGQKVRPKEPYWGKVWKNYGPGGPLGNYERVGACCDSCAQGGSCGGKALGDVGGPGTWALFLGLAFFAWLAGD